MSFDGKLLGSIISREQWLLRETRLVACLRREGLSDEEICLRVQEENLFQYPTEKSLRRIACACLRRLDALGSERLEELVVSGSSETAVQVNLYSMMCLYPLVRHFMLEEIGQRYAQFDYAFSELEMNAYFTRLAVEYGNFATMSDATAAKLKQVLRRCLVECGMLDAREGRLVPILVNQDVHDAIVAKGDIAALAAFNCREVV